MNSLRILIIALVFPFFLQGQNIEVEKKLVFPKNAPSLLTWDYNKFEKKIYLLKYAFRHTSRILELVKYDLNLEELWTVRLPDKPRSVEFIAMETLGKYVWIFWKQNREGKTFLLYTLLNAQGELLQEYKPLQEFSSEDLKNKREGFLVKESLNRKYFVIATPPTSAYARLRQKENFWYAVFEKDSLNYFSENLNIADTNLYLQFRTLEITNSKNLYFLIAKYERPSVTERSLKSYSLHRKIVGTPIFKEIPLHRQDTSKFFINDLLLKAARDNYLLVAGFWSKRRKGVNGSVFFKISPYSDGVVEFEVSEFPYELLKRYIGENAISKGKGIPYFYLDRIVPRGDGGAVLIGEEFYITRRSYRDIYNNWIEEIIYNYGDILAISLSPEGKEEWTRIIPKFQTGNIKANLSYNCFISPEYLCFVFQAVQKDIGLNLYYSLLSPTGERKSALPLLGSNFRKGGFYFRNLSRQISARKALIFYRERRGKFFTIALVALP